LSARDVNIGSAMGTYHAPDPLTALLLREQARIVECLKQFADGQGGAAISDARRILTALADAETQILYPAFSRVSLRLEAEELLKTMQDERAQQLASLELLAHKRAPRLRKLGAVALGDLIQRHAQQHSALLIPVLASQLPRPLHRSSFTRSPRATKVLSSRSRSRSARDRSARRSPTAELRTRNLTLHDVQRSAARTEDANNVSFVAMPTSDRIFPLCELLLGAAYADGELHPQEKTEIRALLVELAGEQRVEVEACIASFEPDKFDLSSIVGLFRDDSEEERQKLLLLVSTVIEADDEIDLAENGYLRELAAALLLPSSALAGLTVDVEIEDVKDTFEAVRRGPPPLPVPAPTES
jgi:uncharacterized tellurite resistance protein B-like protein